IGNSQHSMGWEAVCSEMYWPLGWGMCTRNTTRTRVFLRPMSVSPFLSSMSALRSFKIPAQSILRTYTHTQTQIYKHTHNDTHTHTHTHTHRHKHSEGGETHTPTHTHTHTDTDTVKAERHTHTH